MGQALAYVRELGPTPSLERGPDCAPSDPLGLSDAFYRHAVEQDQC